MLPESAASTPAAMPISVDLPAPFSPTMAWTSPGTMTRSTPRSACTGPKLLCTRCKSITGTGAVTRIAASTMTQPPGDLGHGHTAQHDDRVGQILGRAAEAERRHELGKISQKERADHGGDDAALGDAADRIAATHHRRDGAEKVGQAAQHGRRNEKARQHHRRDRID